MHGEAELMAKICLSRGIITITTSGEGKPWTAKLAGILSAKSVQGATFKSECGGIVVTPQNSSVEIKIYI